MYSDRKQNIMPSLSLLWFFACDKTIRDTQKWSFKERKNAPNKSTNASKKHLEKMTFLSHFELRVTCMRSNVLVARQTSIVVSPIPHGSRHYIPVWVEQLYCFFRAAWSSPRVGEFMLWRIEMGSKSYPTLFFNTGPGWVYFGPYIDPPKH